MLKIPLRTFQLKPTEYIDKLPIILTRRNTPIATVNSYSPTVNTTVNTQASTVNTPKETIWEDRDFNQVEAKVSQGWCQGHFEKGVSHKRYLISMEDSSGTVKIENKWYCRACLDKIIELVNTEGGRIYGS